MTEKEKSSGFALHPASTIPLPRCANPLAEWLLTEAWQITSTSELLDCLCRRLEDEKIPLWRMFCLIRTLHPQVFAAHYTWRRNAAGVQKFSAPHGTLETSLHLDSTCAAIFDGAIGIRRRLDIPNPLLDFPILEDLLVEGASDYVAMPVPFSDGQINIVSVATDRPGGFTTDELLRISETIPVLGRLLEVQAMRQTAKTLLDTYLGRQTGERVLGGLIKRGDGENIHAVIWFCDLRDSTVLADSVSREAFLGILNDFFDCVAGAVLDQGGEVLRFIGDAALAIFPTDEIRTADHRECCSTERACQLAIAAATDAQARVEALNIERQHKGEDPLRFGLALHVGEVTYGNIGVAHRLEFTVIGAAANEAARLQGLCKLLGEQILMSADFADRYPGKVVPLGRHALRGVSTAQEIFTLPLDTF